MRCCSFVVFLLIAWSPAPAAEKVDWLNFPAGLNYTLSANSEGSSVRIPVRAVQGAILTTDLTIRVTDVVGPNGRPEFLSTLFTARLEKGDDQHGPSLLVQAQSQSLLPGTYTVLVDLTNRVADPKTLAEGSVQTVSLALAQPSPEIEVTSRFYLDQTYGLFGTSSISRPLQIAETSGKAPLTKISLADVREPGNLAQVDDGLLKFKLDEESLNAGETKSIDVAVEGTFPLGTTAGKIELRANELSKPQSVPYEITARRTTKWIYFITGAGFLCGWFIRVYLKQQQEIAEASADASCIVGEILAASSQIPDVTFQRQAADICKVLSDSLNSGKPDVIRAAASTAKAGLQVAVGEFNRLRQEVVGRVEPLRSLILRRWKLTPLLMKSVEEISSRSQHAVQLLEGNSVEDARAGLEDIENRLFPELFNQCHAWRRDVVIFLNALLRNPLPQTIEGAEKFKKGVEAWIESFGASANVTTQVTIAQLSESLEQTHAARAALDELGLHVAREVVRLETWIDEVLDATLRPEKTGQFAAMTRLNREVAEMLPSSFDDPAQAAGNHPGRMLQLQRSWGVVLAAIVPVGVAMDAVRDALNNDQWCVAIEQVKAMLPLVKLGRSIPSMDEPPAVDGNVVRPIVFRSTYFGGSEVVAVSSVPIVSLSGSLAERSRFDRNARRAVFIQTVFFATLFMFVADALYSAKWVGTTIEMLGLFVWAFGVDISSEAVMNAARKIAPRGAE
ncbi:MAG: hypothetical protein U0936_00655 [Planctomycetaceae bacterium]